jgi:hypothetical protein
VPPPGIEPEPPGLQPGAQTIYARVASRGVGTPRCHRIHLSWPPPAPCRCRSAVSFARGTVDSPVLQSAAVRAERVELPFPGSEPGVLPVERSPNVIGLDKIERSPRVASIDKHCVGVDGVEPPRSRRPPGYSRVPCRSVTLPDQVLRPRREKPAGGSSSGGLSIGLAVVNQPGYESPQGSDCLRISSLAKQAQR